MCSSKTVQAVTPPAPMDDIERILLEEPGFTLVLVAWIRWQHGMKHQRHGIADRRYVWDILKEVVLTNECNQEGTMGMLEKGIFPSSPRHGKPWPSATPFETPRCQLVRAWKSFVVGWCHPNAQKVFLDLTRIIRQNRESFSLVLTCFRSEGPKKRVASSGMFHCSGAMRDVDPPGSCRGFFGCAVHRSAKATQRGLPRLEDFYLWTFAAKRFKFHVFETPGGAGSVMKQYWKWCCWFGMVEYQHRIQMNTDA